MSQKSQVFVVSFLINVFSYLSKYLNVFLQLIVKSRSTWFANINLT